MTRHALLVLAMSAGMAGCGTAPLTPGAIELGRDACRHCRMAIVSTSTASQVVAPGDEPLVFDDIGCLRDFATTWTRPPDAIVFVADHRTGHWVDASRAVFTRTSVTTPMGSGLVAHADMSSRDLDPAARGGTLIPTGSLLP